MLPLFLRLGVIQLRAAFFICARAPFGFSKISLSPLFISPSLCSLFLLLGVIHLRAAFFICARAPLGFSFISLPLPFISPYTLPLFLRLGVIHLRAGIFHLRARHLRFLIYFSPTSFYFAYILPLFLRLGVIRSRAAIFHLRARPLLSLIYFSPISFYFPLYTSTLPSVRGYTLARCYFASARAPPLISQTFLSHFLLFPYILPLFLRLGVIQLRAAVFQLRERPLHFVCISTHLRFLSPYMPSLFPRLGVIRLRAAACHLLERPHAFLLYVSSFSFVLYATSLPSVRGYTLARCRFSYAPAPPSVSHIFLSHLLLFPHICFHSSFG